MGHAMERRGTNRRAVKAGRAVTYVVRLPILLLMTLLALSPAPAGADGDAWKRLDKKGIKTGTIAFGISNLFAITCPAALPTAQPRLILHVQQLQTDYDEKSRYNLRIVINDYRADFGMSAQEGTLYFEAKDFNQRDMFQTFVQQLMAAAQAGNDHAQEALSSPAASKIGCATKARWLLMRFRSRRMSRCRPLVAMLSMRPLRKRSR